MSSLKLGPYAYKGHDYKHGYSGTRIDNIYYHMVGRCYNPKDISYRRYGAKGITVCDEWMKDKESFFKWAFDNGYKDDLTIERVDSNKGYCPENCRWATYLEQSNNISTNVRLEVDGVSHTITEWSRISGIKPGTIWARLNNYGWPEKEAIFKPTRKGKHDRNST